MTFQGMDVEDVRDFAHRLREAQRRLTQEHEKVQGHMDSVPEIWHGDDAEDFRSRWDSQVGAAWHDALEALLRTATSTDAHATEQETASDATDRRSGGGDIGDVRDITDDGPGSVPINREVREAWAAMTPEERKAVLQEMVNQEFARYDMDPVDITFFSEGPDEDGLITFGSWNDFWNGTLKLNEYVLDDPNLMLTTVHEVRHAAQYEFIDQTEGFWDFLPWVDDSHQEDYDRIEEDYGVTREEIESWRENFKDYKSTKKGDTFEEYENQPVEVDARTREDEFARDELTFEQLQQYQRDAGVPVSEEPG